MASLNHPQRLLLEAVNDRGLTPRPIEDLVRQVVYTPLPGSPSAEALGKALDDMIGKLQGIREGFRDATSILPDNFYEHLARAHRLQEQSEQRGLLPTETAELNWLCEALLDYEAAAALAVRSPRARVVYVGMNSALFHTCRVEVCASDMSRIGEIWCCSERFSGFRSVRLPDGGQFVEEE